MCILYVCVCMHVCMYVCVCVCVFVCVGVQFYFAAVYYVCFPTSLLFPTTYTLPDDPVRLPKKTSYPTIPIIIIIIIIIYVPFVPCAATAHKRRPARLSNGAPIVGPRSTVPYLNVPCLAVVV